MSHNSYVVTAAKKFLAQLKRRDPPGTDNQYELRFGKKYIYVLVSGCLYFVVLPNGSIHGPRSTSTTQPHPYPALPMMREYYGNVLQLSKSRTWGKRFAWDGYRLTPPWRVGKRSRSWW